jgi:hypothetical protein
VTEVGGTGIRWLVYYAFPSYIFVRSGRNSECDKDLLVQTDDAISTNTKKVTVDFEAGERMNL